MGRMALMVKLFLFTYHFCKRNSTAVITTISEAMAEAKQAEPPRQSRRWTAF